MRLLELKTGVIYRLHVPYPRALEMIIAVVKRRYTNFLRPDLQKNLRKILSLA